MIQQKSIQGALILVLVGMFGGALAYGNVISVDAYYWAILVVAGIVIFAAETVRFARRERS